MIGDAAAVDHATNFSPRTSARCICGQVIEARGVGRPRQSCSERCARRRDHVIRKLRRRWERIHLWRIADRDRYPRAWRRAEIRALLVEIKELERPLDARGRAAGRWRP